MTTNENPVLFVPGPLPNLNDILEAKLNVFIPKGMVIPGNGFIASRLPNSYAKLKKKWQETIERAAKEQNFDCPLTGGHFNFLCLEMNRKRDPDGIGAGAQKIIQDALVEFGRLKNDGWKFVHGYRHFYEVDPANPGVYVIVTQGRCLTEVEAQDFFAAVLNRGVLNSAP